MLEVEGRCEVVFEPLKLSWLRIDSDAAWDAHLDWSVCTDAYGYSCTWYDQQIYRYKKGGIRRKLQ